MVEKAESAEAGYQFGIGLVAGKTPVLNTVAVGFAELVLEKSRTAEVENEIGCVVVVDLG